MSLFAGFGIRGVFERCIRSDRRAIVLQASHCGIRPAFLPSRATTAAQGTALCSRTSDGHRLVLRGPAPLVMYLSRRATFAPPSCVMLVGAGVGAAGLCAVWLFVRPASSLAGAATWLPPPFQADRRRCQGSASLRPVVNSSAPGGSSSSQLRCAPAAYHPARHRDGLIVRFRGASLYSGRADRNALALFDIDRRDRFHSAATMIAVPATGSAGCCNVIRRFEPIAVTVGTGPRREVLGIAVYSVAFGTMIASCRRSPGADSRDASDGSRCHVGAGDLPLRGEEDFRRDRAPGRHCASTMLAWASGAMSSTSSIPS